MVVIDIKYKIMLINFLFKIVISVIKGVTVGFYGIIKYDFFGNNI